ncbi:MAG: LON peptidase substrate-binding domain-containing protein [Hyphomonadaceae bacterium]
MPHTRNLTQDDLPEALPVFPLGGVILLPGAELPLNIFEPRYLAMIDAALSSASRLIGMIQPMTPEGPGAPPILARVGCAGRLVGFQETGDGRYLIVLKGVARFRVDQELQTDQPFRIVKPDWNSYSQDLGVEEAGRIDTTPLTRVLREYLDRNDLGADWGTITEAPAAKLINSLSQGCPFTISEKQALLEARTLEDRCSALIALLAMERPGASGGYVQ